MNGGDADYGADGMPPININNAPHAPTPRSAHSACLIDRSIYVFGGYGGKGFSRADFNDLYSLHVDTLAWTKHVDVTGEPPAKRSCHTGLAVKQTMLVYGGWSRGTRFSDLHSFDTETLTWSKVDSAVMSPPRWQHSCVSVVAVPSWQVFMFGGVTGNDDSFRSQGSFQNDTAVLDTGRMRWNPLETGDTPPVRYELCLVL